MKIKLMSILMTLVLITVSITILCFSACDDDDSSSETSDTGEADFFNVTLSSISDVVNFDFSEAGTDTDENRASDWDISFYYDESDHLTIILNSRASVIDLEAVGFHSPYTSVAPDSVYSSSSQTIADTWYSEIVNDEYIMSEHIYLLKLTDEDDESVYNYAKFEVLYANAGNIVFRSFFQSDDKSTDLDTLPQ